MSEYASSTPSRPASPVGELPNFSSARPFRFTWDPASRKPGPGSVSETTEGRADYFVSNVAYDFYNNNASLTSLPLGTLGPDWSSSIHGFHAISTVVNNPHKRSAPPKAHSSLPAVPPADLPRVRRKDFEPYLNAIGPEWERFQKNAEQGREGVAQIGGALPARGSFSIDVPMTPMTPRPPLGKALPPLDTVPSVFFEADFNLGDPRTFNAVTEQREGEEDEVDPSSLSHSLPLLEKLSHYADTIEQHLIREISVRSTSFFAALSNLQDLQTESEQCLDRISKLRGLLKEVDDKTAKRGLEVVRKECKLRNLDTVRESVRFVGSVVDMTGVAKSLVAAGQWSEALDVIEELDGLWNAGSSTKPSVTGSVGTQELRIGPLRNGRSSPLPPVPESPPASPGPSSSNPSVPRKSPAQIPLSSLQAFAALPAHLQALTMEITSSLTSEFVNVLRLNLVERIDATPENSRPDNLSLNDILRPLLQSLVRTKGVREAVLSWREIATAEVQNTFKRRMPSFDLPDDSTSPGGTNLVKDLRAMAYPDFMELVRAMYSSLMNCIEGIQRQGDVIVQVLQSIYTSKSDSNSSSITSVQEELSGILSSATELAHARASRVIALRAEQNASLSLQDFWILFNESWSFVIKSEVTCRRMIVGLRGTIVSQAKVFLQTFHQAHLNTSAKLVEAEQWNPAEVAPSVQRIVELLVDSSFSDPSDLLLARPASATDTNTTLSPSSPIPSPVPPAVRARPSSPLPSSNNTDARSQASRSPRRSATSASKHLRIEDGSYFAVAATLDVLVLLVDYLKVIMNIPMLTTDTMSRVIELLKSFNSRTCQVVLGAGAMRSAGLKNITAKHLALASQSLSIMIALIPYVRETFRRHLSPKQAVMLVEFDKLKRDYQEHQNEIHAKLIAIMGDRLTAHIKSLQAVRWDLPKEPPGVNDYMELLVKETVTLHKVLSRYLSPSVVEYVMSQVFAAINHRLSEEYTKIELPSQEAKARLLMDAQFLHQKLSALKNVGAPPTMLETVVSEKFVAGREPAPPPMHAPVPAPVQTQTQRFKGMLGRANSFNLKSPMFATHHLEKALPSVSSESLPLPPATPLPSVVEASPSPAPETQMPSVDPMADDLAPRKAAVSPPAPEAPQVNGTSHGDAEVKTDADVDVDAEAEAVPPLTPPKSDPALTESPTPADKLELPESEPQPVPNGTMPAPVHTSVSVSDVQPEDERGPGGEV